MFVCSECGLPQPTGGPCPVDGTRLTPIGDDPLLGQTAGVYRVARLLGVGGMGRVYKGVHPGIGSRVAIKVLSRECAERPDLVERFFSEARAVNLIRHEAIVNVLDLAQLADGRPYIVMEYLDGAPLSDLIEKAGAMPLGGLARLAAEVLDGLGTAHAAGIIHRDLKPDNIFVTPGGRPKILDFGIAKLRPDLGPRATRTGSLLGTPHYMAPEQALSRAIDPRTDIYSFGVILFECVTGRRPFDSDSLFELLRMHVDETPPSPRALRPDLPEAYEQVILHALAKSPDHRFASAQALAHALLAATQGLPAVQWTAVTPATAAQMLAQRTPVSGPGFSASGPGWTPGWDSRAPTTPRGPTTEVSQNSAPGLAVQHPYAGSPMPGPSPLQTPGPPTPPTVSSGQMVTRAGGGGSAKWVLGGVLVLAAAGIAIAVAVSEDGAPAAQGGAASTASTAPASTTPPPPSTTPPPPSTTPPPPTPAVAEAPLDAAPRAEAEAPPDARRQVIAVAPPDAAPRPPKPPATPSHATTGQDWIALQQSLSRDVDPPPGFNPAAFDVAAYLPAAQAAVRQVYPDAKLYRIDADGVGPDGKANLTLGASMYVDYRFISPAHSERPADIPLGVDYEEKCILRVWVEPGGIEVRPITGWKCDETPLRAPRCSPAQVWKKAIARGAPATGAVGELGYRADFSKRAVWYFSIKGTKISEIIGDDC